MFRKSILISTILTLTGCAIAPGMQMSDPPTKVQYEANQYKITPKFVAITADLIKTMPATKNDFYYYIAPEDIINISVWDHPEFSNSSNDNANSGAIDSPGGGTLTKSLNTNGGGFLVNPDGNIFFPLLGYVHVANKTVEQIRSQMAGLLSKYVKNPQVDVRVTSFRSHKVYVMGEVHNPGLQNITDIPLSITDAINLAGGMNPDTANPSQIFVIRGNMSSPTVYWLNAQSADALLLAEHFHLENNDVLFVSPAGVARWNRAISQIMPTIQTIFYTTAEVAPHH